MTYENKIDESDALKMMLTNIKSGTADEAAQIRNYMIESYKPFIIKQVSLAIGRYLTSEHEDALMIGMAAFNDAIDKYDSEKGSFVNFASLMIKSRVIDYLRKEQRHYAHEILEDQTSATFTQSENMQIQDVTIKDEIVEEIHLFKQELALYDIQMEMLVNSAPTHSKTRYEMIILSKKISTNELIMRMITLKRHLPMQEITLTYGTTKKVLKTHRNFIIACIIVFTKPFNTMMSYLKIRGENND